MTEARDPFGIPTQLDEVPGYATRFAVLGATLEALTAAPVESIEPYDTSARASYAVMTEDPWTLRPLASGPFTAEEGDEALGASPRRGVWLQTTFFAAEGSRVYDMVIRAVKQDLGDTTDEDRRLQVLNARINELLRERTALTKRLSS